MNNREIIDSWIELIRAKTGLNKYGYKNLAVDSDISPTYLSGIVNDIKNIGKKTERNLARGINKRTNFDVHHSDICRGAGYYENRKRVEETYRFATENSVSEAIEKLKTPPIDSNVSFIEIDLTDTIPLLVKCRVGAGTYWVDSYPVGEGIGEVPRYGVKGKRVFAVEVDGESMLPDLQNGDILIIDSDKIFTDVKGGIAVIRHGDDRILIRKVFIRGDYYLLEPSNKEYEPDLIPCKEVQLYKIVKSVRSW